MKSQKLDALLFPAASGASIAAKPGYPTVIVPFGTVSNAPTPAFPAGFDARPAPVRRQLQRDGVQRATTDRARVRIRAGNETTRAASCDAVTDDRLDRRLRVASPRAFVGAHPLSD